MYYYNGFVYGNNSDDNILITDVKALKDRMMLVSFSSGEKRLFDSTVLSGPAFALLENTEVFMSPVIDHGVITWAQGDINCAPEYIYEHSFEYSPVL